MGKITHGGDWAGFQEEKGSMPLDFSSNVSPLGLPERAKSAVKDALREMGRYPDPLCRDLRKKISERYGVPEERIVCGNGAADLIWRTALRFRGKKVLLTAPTFSEYEKALTASGAVCESFQLSEDHGFLITEEILDRIDGSFDLLILCEPNNPTGRTTEPALLNKILTACMEKNVEMVVDECFLPFLEDPESHTLIRRTTDLSCLTVLRAFTKTYGMAGLRLGFAVCGSEETADHLRDNGQPWAVSTAASAAGIAALEDREYAERLHSLIGKERPRFRKRLEDLGCKVIPGEANYLLFRYAETALCSKMRESGILLRDCSDFSGLGPCWYRTAVRTRPENETFLRVLEEVLKDGETDHGTGHDVRSR